VVGFKFSSFVGDFPCGLVMALMVAIRIVVFVVILGAGKFVWSSVGDNPLVCWCGVACGRSIGACRSLSVGCVVNFTFEVRRGCLCLVMVRCLFLQIVVFGCFAGGWYCCDSFPWSWLSVLLGMCEV